ncbi:GGDEF domain-containing protein [Massilia glaciei]|uniref:diguanylate cyclase n=1 Tax=Massilia glaciei TaxID=1524097 RepID=A0A2U2I5V3_9BURK|nr:GGDEF domain-containing protein [Massilia glaciei]PWF55140.1 GGDEF domain-containing protein [Massilia glaciei]
MQSISIASKFLLFSQAAAAMVTLVGGIVLAGWWFNVAILKTVAPGLVSMKANTATCLLAAGVALFLLNERFSGVARKRTGLFLALAVFVIAGLTLAEYALRREFGIDELLFDDDTRATSTSHPGRMAPVTALSLFLVGAALLLVDRATRVARRIAMWVLLLAMLGILGYAFEVESMYRVSAYTSMAVHTALALAVLSLGIITSRTRQGCMDVILSDSAGGTMARRLLLLIPVLLFGLGWLSFQGQKAGFYDSQFGFSLVIATSMGFSAIFIMNVAHMLQIADAKRFSVQRQLATLNYRLEQTVLERTSELENVNQNLAIEIAERKQAEKEVRRLSVTDELTGLLNRRGFLLLAEQDLRAAKRAKAVRALIYLDLDGLKHVNDTHGHKAGDALLIESARVLKVCFRDADIVARLGGDEFSILAANGEKTEIMLTRIHAAVAQFNQGGAMSHALSFSIGAIRCLPTDERSLLEQLNEADTLMYEQKKERRLRQNAQRSIPSGADSSPNKAIEASPEIGAPDLHR